MPSQLSALLADWLAAEQLAGTTMFVAAFLLFAAGLARILAGRFLPGERVWRTIALCAKTVAFMALVWSAWFLLRSSNDSFGRLLGQLIAGGETARKQQAQLATNWGGGLDQSELRVEYSVQKEIVQEFPQAENKPVLYLRKQVFENLEQDGIIGFQGVVTLHLVDAALSTYECVARYGYDVLNSSDLQATATYAFPFSSARRVENVLVELDGKPVAWTIGNGSLLWTAIMAPHQHSRVEISFETRGLGAFSYTVPSQRVIQNYSLTVVSDSAYVQFFVAPTSSAIKTNVHAPDNAKGLVMQWTIDHAIMSPTIAVQFVQPPKNSLSTALLGMINYAARGLVLLLSLITLTLVICGENVSLGRLALVSALFCAQFLALTAVYPAWFNYVWPVWLFSLATLALCYLVLKPVHRLPLVLALVFIALFAAAYPFVGLVPGERERNAIDGSLQAGMILYIFGLTLYTRIRSAG